MYHKIQHFKVYNSMVFFQNIFVTPQKKSHTYKQALSISPSSELPGTTNLPAFSVDLPILDISYKWNPPICGLLCLASFTQHNVVKVHPCCSLCQYFVSFYC